MSAKVEFTDLPIEEALKDHHREWSRLAEAAGHSPTIHPVWHSSIVEVFAKEGEARALVGRLDGEVVTILPYFSHRTVVSGVRMRTIELTGSYFCYHQELLGGPHGVESLHHLLENVRGGEWDLFIAVNVNTDGPTAAAFRAFEREGRGRLDLLDSESSPAITINDSWENYLAQKRKKFRYKLKRRARDISQAGEINVDWYEQGSDVGKLLAAIMQIEAKSWKVPSRMAITQNQVETRYHESLLPRLSAAGMLLANVLSIDGVAVAYSLCYTFAGVVGQMKTSYDDDYGTLSPGAYVNDLMIRRCFTIGATEFDFLGDVMPHKMEWADMTRKHQVFILYGKSRRARLVHAAKRVVRRVRQTRPAPVAGEAV